MKTLPKINPLGRNFILYVLFGCVASGANALLFACLYYLVGFSWTIANILSVIVGLFISFVLNRKFNFRVLDHPIKRAVIFFAVGGIGLILSQLILWIGSVFEANMLIAKIISIIIVGIFQFALNKIFSFGIAFSRRNAEQA